ncbi:STAS domain-containing protein [Litoribrevibacter albus]|uniref:STAS domain-containing protein n=1 Tax=Litoribrevibacter albus TaxID=1473156 RepID=A0AA37SAC9_9GAMM|nr:STAS domain-containing protein [Litoribrevibacter albus]GLQ32332.1 hypothetical protein GCM10007876_28110 [Litoribrevibacter albus]
MPDLFQIDAGEKLHISVVERLHEQLELALSNHQSVELDVSKVAQTDTASLQLLYAFKVASEKAGLRLVLLNPTESVSSSVKLLGLNSLLGSTD